MTKTLHIFFFAKLSKFRISHSAFHLEMANMQFLVMNGYQIEQGHPSGSHLDEKCWSGRYSEKEKKKEKRCRLLLIFEKAGR